MNNNSVALFCHVDEHMSDEKMEIEFNRQYQLLERCAVEKGLEIDYCTFHAGGLNCDAPDKVLLAFINRVRHGDFGMVIAEKSESFPQLELCGIPRVKVYFLQEKRLLMCGNENAPVCPEKTTRGKSYLYVRKARKRDELELE